MKFTWYIVEFKIIQEDTHAIPEKRKKIQSKEKKKQNKKTLLGYYLIIKETNSKSSVKYLELAFLTLVVNIIILSEH